MSVPSGFGASTDSPRACAALLRALASRFGVAPVAVDDVPLAAACVAAELWCDLHRADAVTDPARYGAAAAAALTAAVRLSAIGVAPAAHHPCGAPAPPERFADALERCREWMANWFTYDPEDRAAVAVLAAACLAAGADTSHLAVADLLLLAAEDWAEAWMGD